jgi:hypothetical protein
LDTPKIPPEVLQQISLANQIKDAVQFPDMSQFFPKFELPKLPTIDLSGIQANLDSLNQITAATRQAQIAEAALLTLAETHRTQIADLARMTQFDIEPIRKVVNEITNWRSQFDQLFLESRLSNLVFEIKSLSSGIAISFERSKRAHVLASAELPKRGWYLSSDMTIASVISIGTAIEEKNWERVDQIIIENVPDLDLDDVRACLREEGIPDYTIERFCKFLNHHRNGNYEEATSLGVPLIDELCQQLYGGKPFTTKRKRAKKGAQQERPEIALKSPGTPELNDFCKEFLNAFGSLQQDVDYARLADEDYFNRSAIVHGLMKRAMGIKDSAKCLMAIYFLFNARVESQVAELEATNS